LTGVVDPVADLDAVNKQYIDDPSNLAYTPGDGSNWADPDPDNIQDALDRMAALLYTLNSDTPIP
jgi:hypothetical protein